MGTATAVPITQFQGLNITEDPAVIADNELSECVNFTLGRAGELIKRNGLERLHNGTTLGTGNIRILAHFLTTSISQFVVVNDITGELFTTVDGSTYTSIGTVTGANFAVQYVGKLYIVSSSTTMREWDGTTLTDIVGSPSGTFVTMYKDRIWVFNSAGSSTVNSRLYFSGPGDPTSWPSTNFIDVQPGDGDFLVTGAILQDLFILMKGRSSWALYIQGSPENWILRNQHPTVGCISKYSIREIDSYLYFIAADAIYRTDGVSFKIISQPIKSSLDGRVVNSTTYNIDNMIWWDNKLICILAPTPSTRKYYVYNLDIGGWTEWTFGSLRPWTAIQSLSTSPGVGLYFGSAENNGRVYRMTSSTFSDVGASFECRLATKQFDFDSPESMKRGKWVAVDSKGVATLTVKSEVGGTELEADTLNSLSHRSASKMVAPGYFRTWRFKLSFSSSVAFTFFGLSLVMVPKRTLIART